MAGHALSARGRSEGGHVQHSRWGRGWSRGRGVVAVLQPCTLVRALGRRRPDGRCDVRSVAPRPRVAPGWRRDADRSLCRPRGSPRPGRGGSRRSSTRDGSAARHDRRRDSARMRGARAAADGWGRWQLRCGLPVAVVADCRGETPGPSRRRARGDLVFADFVRLARGGLRSGGGANRCGVAGLSWTAARRRNSRCADRDRLVAVGAGRAVAPPGGTGLVLLRHRRRSLLHPGAAR